MNRMNENNTAVIIVDIQERLSPAIADTDQLTDASVTLLRGAQILGLPIFATEQYPKGLGRTIEPLQKFLSDVGTFEKREFTYATENILQALAGHDIEHVIVLGMETHICVFQGTRQLLDDGYEVYLPLECVGSRTNANKENGLYQLGKMGAHITNVETVLYDLIQTSEHPAFREISALIK